MAYSQKLPVFAERFRELRGDRSQAEFAKFLGLSRPTVGFYENGERLPDALVLKDISHVCKVSADYLLGISDCKSTDRDITFICDYTGLSESAVAILNKSKSDLLMTTILNYLIKEQNVLSLIMKYYLSFLRNKLIDSKYKHVPIITGNIRYVKRILFSAIIESLPTDKERFENIITSDQTKLDRLLFSYLMLNADIEKCKKVIESMDFFSGVDIEPPEYTAEELQDMDELVETFYEKNYDEIIKENEEYEQKEVDKIFSISNFLKEYQQYKRGDNHVDN